MIWDQLRKGHFFVWIILFAQASAIAQKVDDEPTSYQDDFSMKWVTIDSVLTLQAISASHAPLEIILKEKSSGDELQSMLLKPFDSISLVSYSGPMADSTYRQMVSDCMQVGYFLGHKDVISPNLNYSYSLPYPKGRKYEVTQGFNGKVSHNTVISKYAIDFRLLIGDRICAARAGTVVKVVDWFTKQGGEELINAANRILIMHDDGTIASYVHLSYKSSFVKVGDKIEEGQVIGLSGNTGYSSGPHLHFVVRKERDIAIPVFFKGFEDGELKQGKRYKNKR